MNVVRRNVLEAWVEYFYIFDNNITAGFYDLLKDYMLLFRGILELNKPMV